MGWNRSPTCRSYKFLGTKQPYGWSWRRDVHKAWEIPEIGKSQSGKLWKEVLQGEGINSWFLSETYFPIWLVLFYFSLAYCSLWSHRVEYNLPTEPHSWFIINYCFWCTAKWLSLYIYIYIYIFFSIWLDLKHWSFDLWHDSIIIINEHCSLIKQ